jgi:hypothetical protein
MLEYLLRPLDILDPPLAVRQLIFESEWEGFPYGMHGSGFLAFEETLFLITAAHCLQEGQQNTLRVPIRPGDAKVMAFAKFMTFMVPGEESHDLDIAVLSIKPDTWVDRHDLRQAAIPIPQTFSLESILNEVRGKCLGVESVVLRAVGFPRDAQQSRIDLAQSRIVSQPMELVFRYSGRSEVTNRHLGTVVHSPLENLDGMSGSPVVLRTTRPEEAPRRYVFVGMLVRAAPSVVEFVSDELIRDALQRAVIGLRQE